MQRRITTWMYPGAVDQKDLYVDGLYEEHNYFCGAPTITKYYMAFGRIIARRDNGALLYLLADHLGSTVGSIAASGNATLNKYWPYGGQFGNASPGDKAFTGQQQEMPAISALHMYYYHARFYSTDLGHFLSADSVAPTADSRGLNRYAYAANNPLRTRIRRDTVSRGSTGQRMNATVDSCSKYSTAPQVTVALATSCVTRRLVCYN